MAVTINGSTGVDYADNIKQKYGTGGDLEIYHNGSHSFINETGSGNLAVQTSAFSIANPANDETLFTAVADGAITAYHNNSKKFETLSTGVRAQGGICFGSDTAAANHLDDYEEGTWGAFTGSAVGSGTIAANKYTKVGNLVTVKAYLHTMDTFSSGHALELTLPFTVVDDAVGSVMMTAVHWDNTASYATSYVWSANKMRVYITRDDASWYTVQGNHLSTSSQLFVTLTYMTTQ